MNPRVIIISAPSGAGKTTIVKEILKDFENLEFSISATTRKPREGEVNGKDYYFLEIDDFRKKINNNEFVEYEEVYDGLIYGTLESEVNRICKKGNIVIFDVDVKGGVNLKQKFGDNALSIFIKPPSVEELKIRLINRGTDNEEVIKTRIARAYEELTYENKFDVAITNDELEEAVKETYERIKKFIKQIES